jgi:RNA polymerase sigma factor (sigma-70 family)
MPTGQMTQAIQHLRRAVLWRDGAGLSDAQLLEHFIERRDEAAFETLVRRHGPMVLGVCRRLLRNGHDADDAFQATFLVLVRKAACIAPKEMVGHWLYGVAYQTALKGRAVAAKRRMRERQLALIPEPETKSHDLWSDLQSVLDQEVSRLPYKYRVPFVLCDLEEKTYKEAARQLGWPEGTLSVRLARARKMLAKRLTRQGFAITGAALAVVLSQNAASACVPPTLVSSTVKAAGLYAAGQVVAAGVVTAKIAVLTEGVLKTMMVTKFKTGMAVFVTISILGIGGGALSYSLWAGNQPEPKGQQEAPLSAGKQVEVIANNKNSAQTDKDKLQGVWKLVRLEALGKEFSGYKLSEVGDLVIEGDRLSSPDYVPEMCALTATKSSEGGDFPITLGVWRWRGTFNLDTNRSPKRISISNIGLHGEVKVNGIYSLDGDELTFCWSKGVGTPCPTEFKTDIDSTSVFATYKRVLQSRRVGQADEDKLLGEWVGKDPDGVAFTLIFGLNNFSQFHAEDGRRFLGTYAMDFKQTPHSLDFHWQGPLSRLKTGNFRTIMELKDEGQLRIELTTEDKPRPKEFTANSAVLNKTVRRFVGMKAPQTDKEKMQGSWQLIDGRVDGEKIDVEGFGSTHIYGDTMTLPFGEPSPASFKLDTTKKPKQITLILKTLGTEGKMNGIYSLDGDDLTFCFTNKGNDAAPPRDFAAKKGSDNKLFILKRPKETNGYSMPPQESNQPRLPAVEKKQSKANQPGLDSPVAFDFGFPINKVPADNKQLFTFWTGFFGH